MKTVISKNPDLKKVERKVFKRLNKNDFEIMGSIYKTAKYVDPIRNPTLDEYRATFRTLKGTVFILYFNNAPAGFAMCIDKKDHVGNKKSYSDPSIFFKDEIWYLKELGKIGDFCFIMRIVIHKDFRRKGLGSFLVQEIKNFYTGNFEDCRSIEKGEPYFFEKKRNPAILLASTIPSKNFGYLSLLKSLEFSFIDHYRHSESEEYLCRVIKVLDKRKVFKSVQKDILAESFKTFIPLQLHSETENINRVIQKMGAEIIWSAFNQTDEILGGIFKLPTISMGFYGAVLKGQEDIHDKITNPTLLKLLSYFKDFEEGIAPSLTESLESNAFELLFLDHDYSEEYIQNEIASASFPFSSLIVLNIKDITIDKLTLYPQLWPKNRLSSKKKKFTRLLHKKSYGKFNSAEEEKEWEKLKSNCFLSDEKEKVLLDLTRLKGPKLLSKEEKDERRKQKEKIISSLIHLSDKEKKKWQDWIDLHKELYKNTLAVLPKDEKGVNKMWGHAVIPVSFSQGVKRMMFSFVVEKDSDLIYIASLVRMIASSLATNMFNILLKLTNRVIEEYLLRNSISRILARNISHNLGSHVLAIISSEDGLANVLNDEWNSIEIGQLAAFNAYLRTRMDFIADISTSDPVVSVRRKIDQEILQKFKKEDVVCHFISGTDVVCKNINFKNRIDFNADPQIQIPNGELGKHALYIIMENIIRNSVKHARKLALLGEKELEITLELYDESPKGNPQAEIQRFYRCVIYDNTPHDPPMNSPEFNIDRIINTQYIYPPVMEKNKSTRTRGWGIIEMKIAAAYLRKIAISKLDYGFDKPLLRAVKVPIENSRSAFYLGYEFYLKKPREILIVDTGSYIKQEKAANNYINSGIRVISLKELGENPNNIFSHEFIIVLGKHNLKSIKESKFHPIRWFQIENRDLITKISGLLKNNPESLINFIWEDWIKTFLARKRIDTSLDLHYCLENNCLTKFTGQDLNNLLIYDLHGDLIKKENIDNPSQKFSDPSSYYFYEPFGSDSPSGRLLTHLDKETESYLQRLKMEFYEAALTDVIILDERIQREAVSKSSRYGVKEYNFIEELSWSRVWIPSPVELNLLTNESNTEILDIMKEWIARMLELHKMDFIVFHLGLLEKLLGKLEHIEDFIEETIFSQNSNIEVILTSGRGKPHDTPPRTRFLHYSNVAQYVVQEKSKYHLCKLLFSARTKETNYE